MSKDDAPTFSFGATDGDGQAPAFSFDASAAPTFSFAPITDEGADAKKEGSGGDGAAAAGKDAGADFKPVVEGLEEVEVKTMEESEDVLFKM